jgi:double-stranded uracil-DNA glycosylase
MVAAVKAASSPSSLQRGLPPVLDAATQVLILGSFPGVASLTARQYYAHPRNHFWPLLGALLELPLKDMPYAHRLTALHAYRIGLWDSIVRCARTGSADAAIRRAKLAEIALAQRRSPELELVCFNGQTAARAAPLWREAGYAVRVLPSTSPAYTLPFAEKLAAWRETIVEAARGGGRSGRGFAEQTTARR